MSDKKTCPYHPLPWGDTAWTSVGGTKWQAGSGGRPSMLSSVISGFNMFQPLTASIMCSPPTARRIFMDFREKYSLLRIFCHEAIPIFQEIWHIDTYSTSRSLHWNHQYVSEIPLQATKISKMLRNLRQCNFCLQFFHVLRSCQPHTWTTSAAWWNIPSSPWNFWPWSAFASRCPGFPGGPGAQSFSEPKRRRRRWRGSPHFSTPPWHSSWSFHPRRDAC